MALPSSCDVALKDFGERKRGWWQTTPGFSMILTSGLDINQYQLSCFSSICLLNIIIIGVVIVWRSFYFLVVIQCIHENSHCFSFMSLHIITRWWFQKHFL